MSVRLLVRTSLLATALAGSGCASASSIRWNRGLDPPGVPAMGRVCVMEPLVEGSAAPGNVGRNISVVKQEVRERLLAIVSEHSAVVDVVVTPHGRIPALASYPAALSGARLTSEELDAANAAFEVGATHLLVPTILQWTVMRTDDLFGAFILSHNQIAIDFRLMQLQPPALVGDVIFKNRARLTLNQPPMQLLDGSVRRVVLQLAFGRQ